jgi:peptidylprolyl isomerase
MRRFLSVCSATLLFAAGFAGVSSCGDRGSKPVSHVKIPPGFQGPTTQELMDEKNPPAPALTADDFDPIPDLGKPMEVTTPDGLVWQNYPAGIMVIDEKVGTGESPKVGQTVKVNYVGTFPLKGDEFDRSPEGQPFEFVVGKKQGTAGAVIEGWDLAISTMKPGGKRKVWIPDGLAYGLLGSGKIPGGSALIFDMELVSVSGEPVDLSKATTKAATKAAATQGAGTMPGAAALTAPAGPPTPATIPSH